MKIIAHLHEVFPRGRREPASHHEQLVAFRNGDDFVGQPSADRSPITTDRFGFFLLLFLPASRPPPKPARREGVEALDRLSNLASEVSREEVPKVTQEVQDKWLRFPALMESARSLGYLRRECAKRKTFFRGESAQFSRMCAVFT